MLAFSPCHASASLSHLSEFVRLNEILNDLADRGITQPIWLRSYRQFLQLLVPPDLFQFVGRLSQFPDLFKRCDSDIQCYLCGSTQTIEWFPNGNGEKPLGITCGNCDIVITINLRNGRHACGNV